MPGFIRQRVRRQVEELRTNPRPPGAKEQDPPCPPGFYRMRFDRYRLVRQGDDEMAVVRVLRAGLKEGPDFYEGLPG